MQFFNDKSNELFSQYIDSDALNALAVFLKSSKPADLEKSAITIAAAWGNQKAISSFIDEDPAVRAEAEAKLITSFHKNLKLLVEKTWVEKSDETVKEQLVAKLDSVCEKLTNKEYSETYEAVLSILSDAVFLMFGSTVKTPEFAEYALRIDPDFGTFWWFLKSLPKEQNWSQDKTRIALLLGMYFLANY